MKTCFLGDQSVITIRSILHILKALAGIDCDIGMVCKHLLMAALVKVSFVVCIIIARSE